MELQQQLIRAIYGGQLAKVEELLNSGAHVNDPFRRLLPIVEATRHGLLPIVQLLLERGASVDLQEPLEEHTGLSVASAGLHESVIRELLRHGADVNRIRRGVSTPLREAAVGRGASVKTIVRLLLDSGADPNVVFHSQDGDPVRDILGDICNLAKVGVVEMLIDAGANVNAKHFFGTPLAAASEAGRLDVVTLLLARGTDPSIAVTNAPELGDAAGKTPLELAKLRRHQKVAALLESAR